MILMKIGLVIYGSLDTISGGYYYDRRLVDSLKKFCKHLVKLFLKLKESYEDSVLDFLEKMVQNINKWEFSG